MTLLWTVLPMEFVLQQDDGVQPSYQETLVKGVKVVVERMSIDECRIVRIISTDPKHFLQSDIQPGLIIRSF